MVAICKGCQHQRRWPIGELVARYGRSRLVQDLWVRWRCSRCGSPDCLPYAVDS
jgi:RNase P subunit RPR2